MKRWFLSVIILISAIASFSFAGCSSKSKTTANLPMGGMTFPPGQSVDLKEPPAGTSYKLTILHTNDIHGQVQPLINNNRGGLARHSWLNQTIRYRNAVAGRHTLILNGGDTRDGTTINDATQTVAVWQAMNLIGYDATVIGNHDHIEGLETLYNNFKTSFGADVVDDGVNPVVYGQHMKVLYGNINPDRVNNFPGTYTVMDAKIKDSFENAFIDPTNPASPDPTMYPSTIDQTRFTPKFDSTSKMFNQKLFYDMNGFLVGIFGATNTDIIYSFIPSEPMNLLGSVLPAGITGEGGIFYNANPLSNNYTNQMIDYLADPDGDGDTSDGANIIICLSHTGVSSDMDIARYGRGPRTGRRIDLVVGAHSHTQLNRAVEVVHPIDGTKSWVVQAKASGMFLGRVDLDVVNGKPVVVNSGLIEVDGNVPEDPIVKALIDYGIVMPGGVNDWFMTVAPDPSIALYGVKPTDVIGNSEVNFKTTVFMGENPLTNLISNAFLWRGQEASIFNYPTAAWETRVGPGYTDFALLIPFVLHGEGVLAGGPITVEAMLDTLHIHEISRNPSRPDTMNIVALTPIAPITLVVPQLGINTTIGSQVEMFLEVLYGIVDLFDILAQILPPAFAAQIAGYKGAVQEYLGTLQWAGISFVVDFSRPPLDRINPSTILINGAPLDPNRVYYFSMNSTIAKFLGAIGQLMGLLFSSDFMQWDATWSETNVPEWVALMDYIRFGIPGSYITSDMVSVNGNGLRTREPDLTLQPWEIQFSPAVALRGGTVTIREWILNTGMTGVYDADIDFSYDPTPTKLDDNPDGYTDIITGYTVRYIGRDHVRDVPPYTDHIGAALSDGLTWTIPTDIAPGNYEICADIRNLVSPMPEYFTGNNNGAGLCATLTIQ